MHEPTGAEASSCNCGVCSFRVRAEWEGTPMKVERMTELELGLTLCELRQLGIAQAFPGPDLPRERIAYPYEAAPGHPHIVIEDTYGRIHELCVGYADIERWLLAPNEGPIAHRIGRKIAADFN